MSNYSELFGYNKEEARKDGLNYAIKEIEKLLGTLDVDITESQGAMLDLFARLEEEKIYQEILKFLDPNYKLDLQKLNKEAWDRYLEEDKHLQMEKESYLQIKLKESREIEYKDARGINYKLGDIVLNPFFGDLWTVKKYKDDEIKDCPYYLCQYDREECYYMDLDMVDTFEIVSSIGDSNYLSEITRLHKIADDILKEEEE